MTLENECKRIADALEKIVQMLNEAPVTGNTTPTPPPQEKKKKPGRPSKKSSSPSHSVPSVDDVVQALQKLITAHSSQTAAKSLLEKYGAKRASDIPEDKRAEFIKEALTNTEEEIIDTAAEEKNIPPDIDEVVKALQAFMVANGRDAAVELLTKYEAKRASDIPEDKRAEFIKEATA
jgi:hypothetical protein